jgi:anti-sigma regulatory factor (Ser/Thr protein kinase)
LLDDARLVVTELATNAIVHAGSAFLVLAQVHESGVRVSVSDNSPIRPAVRGSDPLALSGRGLQLVQALSDDWGVEVTAEGKTVWADLRA